MRGERVCVKYQPEADLAARWPDWAFFETTDIPRGEHFSTVHQSILVNSGGDREWAVAHVLAHLDLGHHLMDGGTFTEAQEADADLMASIRLDLLRWTDHGGTAGLDEPDVEGHGWDDVPMDGDPTVDLR